MEFTIRKAVLDDSEQLGCVMIRSWQSAYRGIVPDNYLDTLSVRESAAHFRAQYDRNINKSIYSAVLDGTVIGVLSLLPCRDQDLTDTGEIQAIYLLPEYRGKGYGTRIMDFAVEILKAQFSGAMLWTLEANIGARRFYEKCGFAFDGTKKEVTLGKPLTAVRYRKSL